MWDRQLIPCGELAPAQVWIMMEGLLEEPGCSLTGTPGAEKPGPCQTQLGSGRLPASLRGPQHPLWVGVVGGPPAKAWGKPSWHQDVRFSEKAQSQQRLV